VLDAEFNDPRLTEIYDAEFGWSRADDFFAALVNETPGARVLDLGCGTGRLALGLAAAGHVVTGVDPAPASLAAARRKPGADRVTWIQGTAGSAPGAAFDIALMTSHVAQCFVDDEDWTSTLLHLRRALLPGGRLAFDARDPRGRPWEAWTPRDSRRSVNLGEGRSVAIWTEVTEVQGDEVTFIRHYGFPNGEELRSESTLRFRSEERLRESLAASGFAVDDVYGGWLREPSGSGDGELIVVARQLTSSS
jgi:SAM-dependent methyltransferase